MKINFHINVGPFLPLIIETIQTTKNISEQNFLFDFLNNEINYINSTVKNFLKDKTKVNYNKRNLFFLQSLYQKYLLEKPKDKKMSNFIRHILYDRKKTDIKHIDNHTSVNLPQYINTNQEMSLKLCEPSYISLCPKLKNSEFIDKEPVWIMPQLKHNFNWDNKC